MIRHLLTRVSTSETKLASLKSWRQPVYSLLLCFVLWLLAPVQRLDVIWSDVVLGHQANTVPDKIIVVNVTPEDVIAHGLERLSRKYLASTLTLLANAEALRVLLDFNMARNSTPEEDAEVLAALKLFGIQRIGFAYETSAALRPDGQFLTQASTLNLSFQPDYDGRVRSIGGSRSGSIANPCSWLSTGELSTEFTRIDLRYDPRTIRRVSLAELHAGKISRADLKNSLVIIAHSRELSRTRSTLPLYGSTDRGTILALGTASSLTDYPTISQQRLQSVSILSSLLMLISLYVGYRNKNISELLKSLFRLFALVMVVCWCGTYIGGVPTKPASLALACTAVIGVAVADRLKIFDLFNGLISGKLSPEEVWAWRTYSDQEIPVVLFDAMGYIKKANSAAVMEFQLDPKTWSNDRSALADNCIPSFGSCSKRVVLQSATRKVWDVQWPAKHLPIALFTDVTNQHDKLVKLEMELTTDALTGVLNRKGFEAAIARIEASDDRDYAVFFMDMNGFKAVNDKYGHGAGDILLKVSARRFREAISERDHVARFGGDEFAILVPRRLSIDEAIELRDRIESTLIEQIDVGESLVQVGVAVGFAIAVDENESMQTVLQRADYEMYQRKSLLKRVSPAGAR
jgi:diguanylate cyclase (GGDEF)-like protein